MNGERGEGQGLGGVTLVISVVAARVGCWVSLVVVASVRLGCCGAPLGEGRGPGAGWGHAGRLLGESGGCRDGAARVGCLAAGVMLGCIGRRVPRSAHHRRQVVPVHGHMPNTVRIGSMRQLGIHCTNCCPC